jgi:hypothetical protein
VNQPENPLLMAAYQLFKSSFFSALGQADEFRFFFPLSRAGR